MGRADVYSQPEAPDPVLPIELVRELARPHLPDGVRLDGGMEVDESGGEARVYLFDRSDAAGGVAVKTQRPHRLRPRTSLRKEAALLEALAGPLAGRIPAVHGYDRADTAAGQVEFIVMSRVPGRPAVRRELPTTSRRMLFRAIAEVLRVVHALDAGTLRSGDGGLPRVDGVAALRARLEPNFADLVDGLAARPDRWPLEVPPDRVAERVLAALPRGWTTRRCPCTPTRGRPTCSPTRQAGSPGSSTSGTPTPPTPPSTCGPGPTRRTGSSSARPTSTGAARAPSGTLSGPSRWSTPTWAR